MFNVESRSGRFVIWLVIAALVIDCAWLLFGWPHPLTALRNVFDSDVAAFAGRNQTLLAGVLGLGGLALAYLFNGWRSREEARHAIERQERRMGGALAREAAGLADACEGAARQLVAKSGATAAIAPLRQAIVAKDHLLLSASAKELAQYGGGVASAARKVRQSVGGLAEMLDGPLQTEAAAMRQLATRAMETSLAARGSLTVFEALARKGVAAADKLRVMPTPDGADTEKLLGGDATGAPSRLQSVA